MKNKKCLIVVDLQNDFCPGGSLAVPDGDQVVPVINELLKEFPLVIFTKDWHPENMDAFAINNKGKIPFEKYTTKDGKEDILWPEHCVANTLGADLHKDIKFENINGDFYIFKKGLDKDKHPYSGFGAEGLEEFLKEKEVTDIFISGLAGEYCCLDTAIDSAVFGFNTYFISDAIRFIDSDEDPTKQELYEHNIKIIESWELPLIKALS